MFYGYNSILLLYVLLQMELLIGCLLMAFHVRELIMCLVVENFLLSTSLSPVPSLSSQ